MKEEWAGVWGVVTVDVVREAASMAHTAITGSEGLSHPQYPGTRVVLPRHRQSLGLHRTGQDARRW